jgi:hypothetical protein
MIEVGEERMAVLLAAEAERDHLLALIKAAVRNADSIDHDISYQGHICALIHVVAWRPLEAIGRRAAEAKRA